MGLKQRSNAVRRVVRRRDRFREAWIKIVEVRQGCSELRTTTLGAEKLQIAVAAIRYNEGADQRGGVIRFIHQRMFVVWLTPKFSCGRVKKSERSEHTIDRPTAATPVRPRLS